MKLIVVLACALAFLWAGASRWGGNQMAHPPRRALQDYHRQFLAAPETHGVVLRPFTAGDGTPCIVVEPLAGAKLGPRGQSVRDQLIALKLDLPQPGTIIGTLVLLHGRKGRKEDYLLIAERLCAVGYRCLLPDLPGHGDHPGRLACYGVREAELPGTLLDEAAARFHFATAPAGLVGLSMGGAVAIQTAAKHPDRWSALAVISSFDTLENVARHQASSYFGEFLGGVGQWGAAQVYQFETGIPLASIRSIDAMPRITMPTLIAHGSADHVIPEACGKRLFSALPPSLDKQWVEIPGADHDNVLITSFPIYATIASWMLGHVK